MVVFPCSGTKVGGGTHRRGPSVLDLLAPDLAHRLARARAQVAVKAGVDERSLRPAHQRYTGRLYQAAGRSIERANLSGSPLIILSGGYGVLLVDEPIGIYDRAFTAGDWPGGLLQECLIHLTVRSGRHDVVAFCASNTGYARVVRSTPWTRNGIRSHLVSAELSVPGGAMSKVPMLLGTALSSYLSDGRSPSTIGPDRVVVEEVRGP